MWGPWTCAFIVLHVWQFVSPCCTEEEEVDTDYQHWIQLLVLKLGDLAFIGHRVLLVSTQQIAAVLERLFCMDPFENKFCQIYENLYFVYVYVAMFSIKCFNSRPWQMLVSFEISMLYADLKMHLTPISDFSVLYIWTRYWGWILWSL